MLIFSDKRTIIIFVTSITFCLSRFIISANLKEGRGSKIIATRTYNRNQYLFWTPNYAMTAMLEVG